MKNDGRLFWVDSLGCLCVLVLFGVALYAAVNVFALHWRKFLIGIPCVIIILILIYWGIDGIDKIPKQIMKYMKKTVTIILILNVFPSIYFISEALRIAGNQVDSSIAAIASISILLSMGVLIYYCSKKISDKKRLNEEEKQELKAEIALKDYYYQFENTDTVSFLSFLDYLRRFAEEYEPRHWKEAYGITLSHDCSHYMKMPLRELKEFIEPYAKREKEPHVSE